MPHNTNLPYLDHDLVEDDPSNDQWCMTQWCKGEAPLGNRGGHPNRVSGIDVH